LSRLDTFAREAVGANVYWNIGDIFIPVGLALAILVALILINRGKIMAGISTPLIGTCLFTNLTMALIVPRIENTLRLL
jgi:hypothetical protein